MKRAEDNQKIPGQPRAKGNELLGRGLAETVSEETGQFSDEVQKPTAEAQKVLKLYEAVIKEYAVLDEAEEGAMKTLTLRLRSMSGSCTMWTRSIGRSTRHGRSQREHLRDSKTCVASIGYARSRGSRWRRGFLSHYFSLALALYQVLDRNCLKRSGEKNEHGTEVVERVPGKLKGTLDSHLPTMRPPTRSQHTNFRGVRRVDFNVVVFRETATRATVTSTTSRVLFENRAMPWPTCSAAKQNRHFGTCVLGKQQDVERRNGLGGFQQGTSNSRVY